MSSKLLKRQLRRTLGIESDEALTDLLMTVNRLAKDYAEVPALGDRLQKLLTMIDEAYQQAERDLDLRTRSLEISSHELLEANRRLTEKALTQARAVDALRQTAARLLHRNEPSNNHLDTSVGLEEISHIMLRLAEQQQATQTALQLSEKRLSLALTNTGNGLWDWDIAGQRVHFDAHWKRMLGYEPHELVDSFATFEGLIHPDDNGRVQQVLQEHLSGTRTDYEVEFRMRAKHGSWRWIISRGRVVMRDAKGEPMRMVGTHLDITERKEQELQLLKARDEAEAANRAKGDFLASVSHELRTPMNGIIGMGEVLSMTELRTEQRHYLDLIRSSAESLLAIINDILDFSKIEAGKIEFEHIEFSLRGLLSDVLKNSALRAHQKGLEMVGDVADDVPDRWIGDPGRLKQILINLLSNAVKFTERGEIETTVTRQAMASGRQGLRFAVRDTGIGIAPDHIQHIFEEFTQADSSIVRKFGGTGLGLAICRRLTELMNGNISVESVPLIGSTFRFTVELQALDAAAPRHALPPTRCRILVVDGNAAVREFCRRATDRIGHEVEAAAYPRDAMAVLAMETAAGRPFDAIVVGVPVNADDSVDFITTMHWQYPDLPLLAALMTGQFAQDVRRVEAAGCQHVLTKPYSLDELRAALQAVFEVVPSIAPPSQDLPTPAADTPTDASAEAPIEATTEATTVRKLKVLLAEDNPVNALLVETLLENNGDEFVLAVDGREAVSQWQEGHFDVVLMDVQMPHLDGLQATAEIRRLEAERQQPRTPIIALTANAMQGDREKCLASGMDEYLSKPFDWHDLSAVLDRCARIRAA
ncbi:MAG: response regulator [Betaproteobacteria bacterium]|nr:response regulator [Betaproteobacteria bacterium]